MSALLSTFMSIVAAVMCVTGALLLFRYFGRKILGRPAAVEPTVQPIPIPPSPADPLQEALVRLEKANLAIPDEAVSMLLSHIADSGRRLISAMTPGNSHEVNRLFSTYVEEAATLSESHARMLSLASHGTKVGREVDKLEDGLNVRLLDIADGFDSQIEKLIHGEVMGFAVSIHAADRVAR